MNAEYEGSVSSRVLCVVMTWDWKAQPDISDLDSAMSKVYNGTNRPAIQEVPDTGGDEYAVIVSSRPTDAQAVWTFRCGGDEDWDDAEPFWFNGVPLLHDWQPTGWVGGNPRTLCLRCNAIQKPSNLTEPCPRAHSVSEDGQ